MLHPTSQFFKKNTSNTVVYFLKNANSGTTSFGQVTKYNI